MIVATMSSGHQSRGVFHTFNNFRFMLQGQHDLDYFAAVARVCFQLKKSKFRLTAYAMLRQPHAWEICHNRTRISEPFAARTNQTPCPR